MITIENFISGLQGALTRIQVELSNEKLLLYKSMKDGSVGQGQNELWGEIPLVEIESIVTNNIYETTFNEYMLHKKTYFEVSVKPQERMRIPSYRLFELKNFPVCEHNYEFFISKASPEYLFALMCYFSTHPEVNKDFINMNRFITFQKDYIRTMEELSDFFRLLTVRITAPVECSLIEFKRMTQTYLFNIAYIDNMVISIADLSEYRKPIRNIVHRSGSGQLFPYKSYRADLVNYYYQGASTDIPFTQYLAFYHVAEFFFQTISEQDAFQEIENFITRPSFSPYKKEDIRQFYNTIKKKLRDQREDGVWDERTGLLLCLKKYVSDIDSLKKSINSIDSSAIDYYTNFNTPFVDEGNKINFDETSEVVLKLIRNRIYSVRNSIVHSKDGEKLRYQPFQQDKELAKEVPLVRAVAEEIIVNSAKPMNVKFAE